MKRKSDVGGSGSSENESGSFVLGLSEFRKKIVRTDMKGGSYNPAYSVSPAFLVLLHALCVGSCG